jgi:hypothetical protein
MSSYVLLLPTPMSSYPYVPLPKCPPHLLTDLRALPCSTKPISCLACSYQPSPFLLLITLQLQYQSHHWPAFSCFLSSPASSPIPYFESSHLRPSTLDANKGAGPQITLIHSPVMLNLKPQVYNGYLTPQPANEYHTTCPQPAMQGARTPATHPACPQPAHCPTPLSHHPASYLCFPLHPNASLLLSPMFLPPAPPAHALQQYSDGAASHSSGLPYNQYHSYPL